MLNRMYLLKALINYSFMNWELTEFLLMSNKLVFLQIFKVPHVYNHIYTNAY